MQKEEINIILQNPDGTIQIATQPHYKNKNIIQCWKCSTKLIFDAKATVVKCSCCDSNIRVPGKETNVVIVECVGCGTPLKGPNNSTAIQCPFCRTLTFL